MGIPSVQSAQCDLEGYKQEEDEEHEDDEEWPSASEVS